MFKNVYLKTLYEKRWSILGWSFAMLITTLLIVAIFPIFRESFGEQLKNVPDSLKPILGEAGDYQKLGGFLELQVFAQMVFLTFIYGIILCTSLIAGEENKGNLQTLLALPISRSKVYWHKFLAATTILAIVSLAMLIGTLIGAALIHEPVSYLRVFQATSMQFLLSLALSAVAFSTGALSGRRAVAGTVAGIYTFGAYMVTALAGTAEFLKFANNFSVFKYLIGTHIFQNGIALSNALPLLILTVMALLIGWYMFVRRNIYSQ